MELFKAMGQWAERPADERFWTVGEAYGVTETYRQRSQERPVEYGALRVEAVEGDVNIVGRQGVPARLSHWAFGQVAQRAGAPAGYLRSIPATLAAQNINHGLKARAEANAQDRGNMLLHSNGTHLCRAFTGGQYSRIWNAEVFKALMDLPRGWRTPPARPAGFDQQARPATEEDVLSAKGMLSIQVGDMIAPAGIYASDHDMFAFLVNEEDPVDDGAGNTMSRGVMVWNSEVGAASFGAMRFLYSHVCGNHIVWGAKQVSEIRLRHVGKARGRAMHELRAEMRRYADSSTSDERAIVAKARSFVLGRTREDVGEAVGKLVSKKRIAPLNGKVIEAALDTAEEQEDRYGDPRTMWAVVSGITENSQRVGHADRRAQLDRAAGELLRGVF